jgi:hypothetical protein
VAPTRLAVINAVFDRLETISGIVIGDGSGSAAGRLQPRNPFGVKAEEQQVVALGGWRQRAIAYDGAPIKWEMTVLLDCYARDELNPIGTVTALLDSIEAAFQSQGSQEAALVPGTFDEFSTSLGGVVETCQVIGQFETACAALGPVGGAQVPVVLTYRAV